MRALGHTSDEKNMLEAAKIISECLANRLVEILRPQYNMGNVLKDIQGIDRDSTNVRLTYKNVDARLDIDQNKHQHPSIPIGTRSKAGGNRFTNRCDASWHQNTTLRHMAEWAERLPANPMGKKVFHCQTMPMNSIHYEGFCFFGPNDKRYVLFHCYPADNSKLKL
jgi:hypothetical protein